MYYNIKNKNKKNKGMKGEFIMPKSIIDVKTKKAIKNKKVVSKKYLDATEKDEEGNLKNYTCTRCNKVKKKLDFYKASNVDNELGIIDICKDCLKKKSLNEFGKFDGKLLLSILKDVNKPFINKLFEDINKLTIDEDKKISEYFRYLNMPYYKHKKWDDSDNVRDCYNGDKLVIRYSEEWQGDYNERELEYLNKIYNELQRDYSIKTGNHEDYAKKIAKQSLEVNTLYEALRNCPSEEKKAYSDLYKSAISLFDTLCKSAQFTASTRSGNDVSLGCFGRVFDKVEKKQWIPTYVPFEKDTYDLLIEQFSNIKNSL
jgi:hypothetical protein